MTKEVLVTVVGNQNQEDEITLITEGTYYFKDGKHYVFYDEHMDPESEPVKNRICFDEAVFEMSKKGSVNTMMTFDPENITLSSYQTPYGPIQIEVVTKHYALSIDESVFQMDIYYAIAFADKESTDCHVHICVEERHHGDN